MQESNNKIFNHLKIHTQYSICEGAIKIEDLKNYCKDNKIISVGLSDTSNLCGSLEFSENLSKSGTQPMIGTQILFNFKDEVGLLSLIAMTEVGYKKIVELSSKSYLNSAKTLDPQCKLEHLMDEPEGVILLSGSINGLIGKLFNKGKFAEIEEIYKLIKKNYGDNFYIEIQRHNDQNEKSFENYNLNLSKKLNLPIIATQEIYYLNKSMHDAHEALICIGQ
jgi:DNA polymerase-3 subunit alpha